MALEIHENLKRLLLSHLMELNCTFTAINGETISQRMFNYPSSGSFSGIIMPTSLTRNGYYGIAIGSGERSNDARYTMGNVISTASNSFSSFTVSVDEDSEIGTWNAVAVGKNTSSENITITEVGLFTHINGNDSTVLLAYEHLDSPIIVEPDSYFIIKMDIKIQA